MMEKVFRGKKNPAFPSHFGGKVVIHATVLWPLELYCSLASPQLFELVTSKISSEGKKILTVWLPNAYYLAEIHEKVG